MKKNGFTLIELLASIVVLGIIALIVFPTVDKTIKNQKNKLYKRQLDTIVDASKAWGTKNTGLLPNDEDHKLYVGLNVIVSSGNLENDDIEDPRKDQKITGCTIIKYNPSYRQYEYEFIDLNEEPDNNCNPNSKCVLDTTTGLCE